MQRVFRTMPVLGLILAVVAVMLTGPACERPAGGRAPGPARIVVSIPPLEGLVRALAPADAEVRVLVKPGQSPHGFEPTPSDIASIASADLVVLVGMGIESSLPRSAREGARVLSMAEALGIASDDHDHAGHDHGHAHAAGGIDPHLWLDPVFVAEFVPTLAARVSSVVAQTGDGVGPLGDAEALSLAAREMDRAYREALGPLAGSTIVTQHAGWSRLADRYGLEIAGIIQPDEHREPSPAHIAGVVEAGRSRGAVAVFSEVQLDARLAERVAAQMGLPVGVLDPLGRGDWAAMMRTNLEELVGTITAARPDTAGQGAEPRTGGASGG